jgi:hypothetical protein
MSRVFVFGSNIRGVHGAGAAAYAIKHHGAQFCQGEGLQGASYAIPTKDYYIRTLPLSTIGEYVNRFMEFASKNPDMEFDVTRIGCGLAGYTDKDIAPMFVGAPKNCWFAKAWEPWLGIDTNYNDFV